MRRDLGAGGDLGCRLRNMVFLALVLVVIAGWCAPVMGAVRLAVTEEAYWDKSQVGIGRWKKVERAEEYRVRLYESEERFVTSFNRAGDKGRF